jgi:hypothetical protein
MGRKSVDSAWRGGPPQHVSAVWKPEKLTMPVCVRGVCAWLIAFGVGTLAADWVDLGDEGRTLYVRARATAPPLGTVAGMQLTTAGKSGLVRVECLFDGRGKYRTRVFHGVSSGGTYTPGENLRLVLKLVTHAARKRDELFLLASPALPDTEPVGDEGWTLVNRRGWSDANLARVRVVGKAVLRTSVHVADSWAELVGGKAIPASAIQAIDAPSAVTNLTPPDPKGNPRSGLMLDLPGTGTDPLLIDFSMLPVLPAEHAVVSASAEDVSWTRQQIDAGQGPDLAKPADWNFRLHSYLAFHNGRFWAMWSHGPKVEDYPSQHVRAATSQDGLKWSPAPLIVGPAPHPFRYISRGFWVREGRLLALASRDESYRLFGPSLELRAFAWDDTNQAWSDAGRIFPDAINNFPPKRLPNGQWMMSRRDHRMNKSMLVGGRDALDRWTVSPVAVPKDGAKLEEPFWWTLPAGNLVALFRDNSGSKRLYRAFSTDLGRSWSTPVRTNFPDATSKFNALRTSLGFHVLLSNPNPVGRNPLCLSVSRDGMVFTGMARLPLPERGTYQYPHVVEHGGFVYTIFSRDKRAIEVVRIRLFDLARMLPQEP